MSTKFFIGRQQKLKVKELQAADLARHHISSTCGSKTYHVDSSACSLLLLQVYQLCADAPSSDIWSCSMTVQTAQKALVPEGGNPEQGVDSLSAMEGSTGRAMCVLATFP